MRIRYSYFLLIFLVVTFEFKYQNGWTQNIRNSKSYFEKKSRVGLLTKTEIKYENHYSGGLFSGALIKKPEVSPYDQPLKHFEPQLNLDQRIKDLYKDIYSSKGKNVSITTEKFDSLNLSDFSPDNSRNVKYYDKDVRFFNERYGIDEVLIIKVDYGIGTNYHYGIESMRYGFCDIETRVVDLKTNKILLKDRTRGISRMGTNWYSPPEYRILKDCVVAAIESAIKLERTKYGDLE